jgi:hypothetical protein
MSPGVVTRRTACAGLMVAMVGTGCALVQPGPRTIEISEARLAELVARRFPVDHRYMELLDVSLAQPRLRLVPQDNRIQTELDYTMGTVLSGTRTVRGTLGLSYGLRFDPADRSVRLTEVRVDRFDVPGLPAGQGQRMSRLGSAVAESLLQDAVIHRLRPDELKVAEGWYYEPGQFRVVPGGLQLSMTPVRR